MDFKTRFLYGLCDFDAIDEEVAAWHEAPESTETLESRLGFTNEESSMLLRGEEEQLIQLLLTQRRRQGFRIYQLKLDDGQPTIPFAFCGIDKLHQAGFEQPPASKYQLVYDGTLFCLDSDDTEKRLKLICERCSGELPDDYPGRSIALSDVMELYGESGREYYYRDTDGFCRVKFSPVLAKPFHREKE